MVVAMKTSRLNGSQRAEAGRKKYMNAINRLESANKKAQKIAAKAPQNKVVASFSVSIKNQLARGIVADEKLALRYAKAAELNLAKLIAAAT